MRIVLQRVSRARVVVGDRTIAQIGPGLVLLVGVGPADQAQQARYLAEKIAHLRIFEDQDGKMNRSLLDVGGEAIVVSQFTLYADTRRGRRPSFTDAAQPHIAQPWLSRSPPISMNLASIPKVENLAHTCWSRSPMMVQ